MEWINSILIEHSVIQAVVVIAMISALGLALGKISVYGVSLGVTFVFFAGIAAGHFGLSIDPQMLNYAESFGLIIFVYALGLQVGPGFFGSFRKGGMTLNMLAFAVILVGTAMTLGFHVVTGVSLPDMVGILSGAVTNTPALGAAQQTLKQMHIDAADPALGWSVSFWRLSYCVRYFLAGRQKPLWQKIKASTLLLPVLKSAIPEFLGRM